MDVFVELRATISDFQAKMAAARGEMEKTSSAGSSKFQALGKGAGLVGAGVAVAAVAVAGASVKMGMDLQDAQRRLSVAIQDSGSSYQKFAPQIAAADSKMESFGFTNAQTAAAMAAGVTATGSTSKALSLLTTAANLAAFKHIDLATAMTAVARASEGQTRPLAQLGIIVPALAVSGSTLKSAQDALAKAQANLTAVQEASRPTSAQVAAAHLSVERNALALKRANDAVTTAQEHVHAVLIKYPDAASAASKGHSLLVDANRKLADAQAAATIAAQAQAAQVNNTAPHAKYEAALAKVQAAQGKLNELNQSGGQIMDVLNQKLGGQAADAAQTFAGKMQVAKAKAEDLTAHLGLQLIPIIEKVIGAISTVVTWLEKHTNVALALAAVIGGVLAAALTVWVVGLTVAAGKTVVEFAKMMASGAVWVLNTAASIAETVALWATYAAEWLATQIPAMATFIAEHAVMAATFVAENTVMIASAVAAFVAENAATLGIVAGIAVLIGAIVYLATHWSQVWGAIKDVASEVWGWLQGKWGWLIAFFLPPIGPLVALIAHWKEIWGAMKQVFGEAGAFLIHGFQMLVDGVLSMVIGILEAASHLPFVGHHFAVAAKAAKDFKSDVDGTLSSLADSMSQWGDTAGRALSGGLSKGLVASLPSVLGTTTTVAASVAGAMRKGLGVASPSTVTTEIGMFVAKGLEVGMLGGVSGVTGAAGRLAGAAGRLAGAAGGIAPSGGSFSSGGASGGAGGVTDGGSGPVTVVLQVGTREMARALWPDLQSFVLQNAKRDAVKVGLA